MTEQMKCKIANGLDKTGRIAWPVIGVALLSVWALIVIRSTIHAYKIDPAALFKAGTAAAAAVLLLVIVFCIGTSIESFVKRHKNTGCK